MALENSGVCPHHVAALKWGTNLSDVGPTIQLRWFRNPRLVPAVRLVPVYAGGYAPRSSRGPAGPQHGVRKVAATRAANRGATVAELEAIFGWRGGTMAPVYTREADRRRLALGAMYKLGNGEPQIANDLATSMPAPDGKVRAPAAKDQ